MKILNKVFCVIILVLVLLCVIFLIICKVNSAGQDKKAMIYVDGILYGDYSLSDNIPDFTIETQYGCNIISVSDGKIGVTEADCTDKTCVNMGFTDNSAYPIICMPHRLEIIITDSLDLDGVTG